MTYSNTEFYYTDPTNIKSLEINIKNDEAKHISQVMRHSLGDFLYVTDGKGNVYSTKIIKIAKSEIKLEIISKEFVQPKFQNFIVYMPILKSSDRFEIALEKCVELGITKFIVFSSENSHKRGVKLNRWNKILVAAMKQSLNAYLPKIEVRDSLIVDNQRNSINVIFDQLAEVNFSQIISKVSKDNSYNLIFGPEAGLTENELNSLRDFKLAYLTKTRLRAETAIITAVSILTANQYQN